MKIKERIDNKLNYKLSCKIKLLERVEFYKKLFTENDLVFDIGANHGNRVDPFLKIGAKVIAIEPNPKLAKKLEKKYGDKIDVVQKAIGEKDGVINLYINNTDALSTTSKEFIEKAKLTNRFGELSNQFNQTVEVEMVSIDKLFNKFGYPIFMKIDTEGLEYIILKTLKNNKVSGLSFEFAIPETLDEVILSIEHLNDIGYKQFNIVFGESTTFISNKNMFFLDLINLIKQLPEMSWGDIYAFNK